MKLLLLANLYRNLATWPVFPWEIRMAFMRKATHYLLQYLKRRYYS